MAALGDAFFVQTFTTTLQRYEKTLVDNVLKEHPTLELFKSAAKSITGRGLVIPLRAATLGATGYNAPGGTDFVTTQSTDIMGSAVYEWANEIITPFRLKHRDILQNSGPEQIINLVEEYVKAAQADHQDFVVAELHKLGSAWTSGTINSMDMLVSDSDTLSTTATRTIGGIRGGDSTYAVTNIQRSGANVATITVSGVLDVVVGDTVTVSGISTAGFNATNVTVTVVSGIRDAFSYANTGSAVSATASTGTVVCDAVKDYWKATRVTSSKAATDIVAAFRNVTNSIYAASRKRPTHIVAGFDVFEELEAFLQTKGQYTNPQGTAETRFQTIKFGNLEVRLDPDCQTDRAYFVHMPSLRFAYCAGEFMKSYPAQPLEGTLDSVVPIASTLTFGVAERRANGLLIRTA
jgi:hypothetical protein